MPFLPPADAHGPKSSFHINDFYRYDMMPPSKISAHATEWGPAEVLLIGPRTCQGRPCGNLYIITFSTVHHYLYV